MATSSEPTAFTGFPAGNLKGTAIPNMFFSVLLPTIDSLPGLKLILSIFWRLQQKRGYPRFVTLDEMVADGVRLGIVEDADPQRVDAVRNLLQAAVDKQVLLHLSVRYPNRPEEVYFLNTAQGRRAVEQLRQGEIDIGQELVETPESGSPRRKSIYTLYEQNIGLLTPLIAEQLQEAESLYPADWIEEAFRLAVEYNRRSWAYIRRILQRWALEGRADIRKRR